MVGATVTGHLMHDHVLFGLRVRSDCELPGIPAAVGDDAPHVTIAMGVAPAWADGISLRSEVVHESEAEDERGPALVATRVEVRAGAEGAVLPVMRLAFAEGITFWVTVDGDRVWARWVAPMTFADAVTFLTGPVLGYVLRARGDLALHASASIVGGRAVGFVGPGGAGKSTLAAALTRRGHPLLTDDVLALRMRGDAWMAQPAAPHAKLWDDSARLLLGSREADRLEPLTPTWEKRALHLAAQNATFHTDAAQLGGLLLVGDRASDGRSRIEHVAGRDAIVSLVANTYVNYLLDRAQRAAEFAALARLVADVPIARLVPGSGGADLQIACALIEQWCR